MWGSWLSMCRALGAGKRKEKEILLAGHVACPCNPSLGEAEVRGSLSAGGQAMQAVHSKTLLRKRHKKEYKKEQKEN